MFICCWFVLAGLLAATSAAAQTTRGLLLLQGARRVRRVRGAWGALQLVARYSQLNVDDGVFAAGFAAAGAVDTAKQLTVGVNWYPVPFVNYYATFERTEFEGGLAPARADEHVVLFRAQLAF